MKRAAIALILSCLVVVACGGNGGVKCSFKDPIVLDEGPSQWPKFRRDSQNTGTIRLLDSAYARVASAAQPQREAAWVFPPADQPARGPFAASASLNSALGDDRRLYVGSTDGGVFSLRARDGAPSDTLIGNGVLFNVNPAAVTSSAMVGTLNADDAVVVGTGATALFAVDSDGIILEQVWPFFGDSFIHASPAMTINGLILTNSIGTSAFGVCPNGVGRYIITFGSSESSPALGRNMNDERLDGTFFVGTNLRLLRALRADGVLLWAFSMSAPIVSSPVVQLSPGGGETTAVYAVDLAGLISKVDANGRPFPGFDFTPGILGRTESSPALAEHPSAGLRLYVGSDDGKLYAIDAITGQIIWSYSTDGIIRSSPAVVLNIDQSDDPIVVVGSFDGKLYYIRDTGPDPSLVGLFSVPESPSPNIPTSIESSPTVDIDGTVIFGADNGRLYAIR